MKRFIATIFILVLVGLGVWYATSSHIFSTITNSTAASAEIVSTSTAPAGSNIAQTRSPPQGYKEFRTQPYHFSIFYPDTLTIRDQSGGHGGPFTLVLANSDASHALQIYVQPYNLPTITQERFKLDAPYTSTTNPINITMQGAKGLEFVGSSAGNPDMLEIWFINKGLLYEVTAPASLKGWVESLLQTWEFV